MFFLQQETLVRFGTVKDSSVYKGHLLNSTQQCTWTMYCGPLWRVIHSHLVGTWCQHGSDIWPLVSLRTNERHFADADVYWDCWLLIIKDMLIECHAIGKKDYIFVQFFWARRRNKTAQSKTIFTGILMQ